MSCNYDDSCELMAGFLTDQSLPSLQDFGDKWCLLKYFQEKWSEL